MPENRPKIVVTLADPNRSPDPEVARRKNARYLEAVARAGGEPVPLDETCDETQRRATLGAMDGLLLSGGADLDPALYGDAAAGSSGVQPGRDALERAAWDEALHRSVPVLGICRGLQAINVFMGGRLVQHLDGHQGPGYLEGDPATHPLELVAGTRLATILGTEGPLVVNTYHHQAVDSEGVAPGLVPAGHAGHDDDELVEAIESSDGRWIVGVQCHPERTESTPPEFERLFAAFVEAARA